MSGDYSEKAFFEFMDYLARKHLMKPATVRARKAAAKKLLAALEPNEKQDLSKIDLDDLQTRFVNKSGMDYTPQSRQVYKSRFKSARDDFLNYVKNPDGFKPSVTQRDSSGGGSPNSKKKTKKTKIKQQGGTPPPPPPAGTIVFPIPLRPALTVELHGIPSDMTEQEADRIAAVVKALAQK